MAYYPDLSVYAYVRQSKERAVNIGWLDADHDFLLGATSDEFRVKLAECCFECVNQMRGSHDCQFCVKSQSDKMIPFFELMERRHLLIKRVDGVQIVLGSAEIRVQGDGVIYVAPNLIYHYVCAHDYLPPEEFIKAVLGVEKSSKS